MAATESDDPTRLFERPWDKLLDRFAGLERGAGHLWPRWIFLRALGVIFFSAFYSLADSIHGLMGPHGILPTKFYLSHPSPSRVFFAPSLLWLDASDASLTALVAFGVVASLLVVANVVPRVALGACTVLFLSFANATPVFSSYQSDEMLIEAGVCAMFFAPRGVRPKLGADQPPSPLSLFLLRWEWFRIYFESGVAKLASGAPEWPNLTAMDQYYQNGPLPTWLGWYAHHLPAPVHAACALVVLMVELGLVWLMFLPRPFKLACFAIVTPMQMAIILTANYCFLNYLVLMLGVLLLDDRVFARLRLRVPDATARVFPRWRTWAHAIFLGFLFYASFAVFALRSWPKIFLWPAAVLSPLHLANTYGLFAVMTPARYELEFQGSSDGVTWVAYPFRFKPQDVRAAPGIYAPYQPRFDWNLWFASLGDWRECDWVLNVEAALLRNEPDVVALFADNPFEREPPRAVRVVRWRYWFTDAETKAREGTWWRRAIVREPGREDDKFAPGLARGDDGSVDFSEVGEWGR